MLDDGRVLASGGFTGYANNSFIVPFPYNTIDIYDPELDAWSSIELEEDNGALHSVVKLSDGRVLFVGIGALEGVEQQAVGVAYVFDPATHLLSPLSTPPLPRWQHSMALLDDGRVMVFGGVDVNALGLDYAPQSLKQVDLFDPETDTWRQAASPDQQALQQARFQRLIPLPQGRVIAIGVGGDEPSDSRAAVQMYDSASDTWSAVNGVEPYYIPTNAVRLLDGRLLVLGQMLGDMTRSRGCDSEGNLIHVELEDGRQLDGKTFSEVFSDSKVYDPVTDTWTSANGMEGARVSSTLTVLPDGRVLLAGGDDPTAFDYQPYSTTEVFDPRTNSWSAGPSLSERRYSHSATLLPDGNVLFAGGIGVTETSIGTEEVYPFNAVETIDSASIPDTLPPSIPDAGAVHHLCDWIGAF